MIVAKLLLRGRRPMNQATVIVALVLFGSGALLDRCAPVIGGRAQAKKIQHRADIFEIERDQARKAAFDWKASFKHSEVLRGEESAQANAAVAGQALACDARVAAQRLSAARITALVTKEPRRDPQGCPVRQLYDPRELRDALTPAATR